jgi:hypothetical protein
MISLLRIKGLLWPSLTDNFDRTGEDAKPKNIKRRLEKRKEKERLLEPLGSEWVPRKDMQTVSSEGSRD